ncbi:MAG: rod shape-determining protein MreC, partial [Acidimicrobiia bacterium]|nr:rod shape-determining protein MreC [Acidimicrobiia bacterium]
MAAARTSTHRLVVLLVVTSIAMIAADRQPSSPFTGARQSAITATEPIRAGLDRLATPAVGAWEGAHHYDEWRDANQRLRARIEALEGAGDQVAAAEAELRRLMEATDIEHGGDVETITARVVVNRVSSAVRVIELDRGSTDGIRSGMPVITGRGLVGLVEVAGPDRAIVRPLTADRVRVGVRWGNDYGVAVGSGPDDSLVLSM